MAVLPGRMKLTLVFYVAGSVAAIAISDRAAELTLSGGSTLTARLVAGADGRQSVCRDAAGIESSVWRYDQAAIATSFRHTIPHDGVSTEFHRERGSVTTALR